MKKIMIATGVAVLAVAMIASAQGFTFNTNLTVGSTGSDVSALQSWLINSGYSIPSIASGAAQKGYFGSQTKAAVVAYQTKNGIPSTGFVGPLTRGALNNAGIATVSTPAGTIMCPVGYDCVAKVGTTTTVPGTVAGITTPGVAGSLDLSNGSFVGNGTAVNDGQDVDLGSIALQTGASDMAVTSAAIDFNVRPWLYMTSLSFRDISGKVLATVDGLNQSMFTEITVGQDYRLNVPLNIVLPKATRTVVVAHGMFAVSNRTATSIAITQVQVRSVDGTGVSITSTTDTMSASTMYVAYGGSSNSSLVVTIDGNSPNTATIQTNTGNTQTQNVLLGVFDLKSQNINSTLQGLTVRVAVNSGSVGAVFANLQLKAGSTLLNTGAATTTANAIADYAFSNFNLALPNNIPVAVSVYGTVNGNVNNVSASTSLIVSTANINGIDSASNPLTLASTPTITASKQTFSLTGSSLTGPTFTIAPTAPGGNNNRYPAQTIYSGSFTVTAGNNSLYISTNGATALTLATSSPTVGASLSAAFANFTPADGIKDGQDVAGSYYQITAGGARTFNFNGSLALSAASTSAAVLANVGATSVNLNSASNLAGGTAVPVTTNLQGLNSDFHVPGAYLNGTN